ncbi:MAG: 4Fe-4S dicluster domain-containing protein [Thermoanaerobaculia bacterium]
MQADVYRKLQQHLDRMPVPFPATTSGVELRILATLFSHDEAEVALALSAVPEPSQTIGRRLGKTWTGERVRSTLDTMADRGVIERMKSKGKTRYAKSILAVGIYERQLVRLTPELQRDVEQYFEEGFGAAFHSVRPPQMRTVPVDIKIAHETPVGTYDDIRGYVASSKGPFAVMDCICRHGRDLIGEPCRQTEVRSTCLTFGPAARGMVESGAAHFVEREEVLETLTIADREGLVLQPQNTTRPLFVCCCCGCCCGVLRSAKQLPDPASIFTTNYHAAVDSSECIGCGTCEPRCQMEAVQVTGGVATVDLPRCIGCGLCVTTCATGAMRLVARPETIAPAKDTPALYMKMYRERFGAFEAAKAVGKAILRRQV